MFLGTEVLIDVCLCVPFPKNLVINVLGGTFMDVFMEPVITAMAWADRGLALGNLMTLSVWRFYKVVM